MLFLHPITFLFAWLDCPTKYQKSRTHTLIYFYVVPIIFLLKSSYDHRCSEDGAISSLNFARLSTAIFLQEGFEVHLLDGGDFVATPFIPFGIKHYKCCAGIMVTASHNPKADNGFKVYWGNACQIIPPHDDGIAEAILQHLEPKQTYGYISTAWEHTCDAGVKSGKLVVGSDALGALVDAYMVAVSRLSCRPDKSVEVAAFNAAMPKCVYTPLHGVGKPWTTRSFTTFGVPQDKVVVVPEQANPDPTFPNLPNPNPEDKNALTLACSLAEKEGCGLVVGNDPDADRLAIAEYQPSSQAWYLFKGNDIGVLLGHWAMHCFRAQHGAEKVAQAAVIASVVSSRMLKAMAVAEGFQYADTLTGFKWIGNRAVTFEEEGTRVLFGYEEAMGFAYGDVVYDKDGVSAAGVLMEMAAMVRLRHGHGK